MNGKYEMRTGFTFLRTFLRALVLLFPTRSVAYSELDAYVQSAFFIVAISHQLLWKTPVSGDFRDSMTTRLPLEDGSRTPCFYCSIREVSLSLRGFGLILSM